MIQYNPIPWKEVSSSPLRTALHLSDNQRPSIKYSNESMDEFTWVRKGRWEAQPNIEHQPSQKCALHILPSFQRLNQWTDGFVSVGLRIYIRFGDTDSVIWSNNGALNHLFISFRVIIRKIGIVLWSVTRWTVDLDDKSWWLESKCLVSIDLLNASE